MNTDNDYISCFYHNNASVTVKNSTFKDISGIDGALFYL